MPAAGSLIWRLRFEKRAVDDRGHASGPWTELCTYQVEITWLKGSDPVLAQRLQGVQPAATAVRRSRASAQIDTTCRAVDASLKNPTKNDYFAIRGSTLRRDRAWFDVLMERGADV